ncbi:MAG TPA: RecX family transcriptional regulator [Anaerolineales bacterium]|nr:RecX family transcriptional regulator [Anaerolineales bacterium]
MAKITAIEPQKRDPDRVNIHLDGNYAFGLARITAAWLKVGQELSEERVAGLRAEDDRERAYQQALLFLSYRARSESEIRQNLSRHGFPPEVIERTVERLRENRLADDKQFARAWVENRNTFRPRSRRALQMELRQKGLSDEAARPALEGLDEEALAYEAGLKKARRLQSEEWREFRKKTSDYLARRGFSYSVVTSVVARIWKETHPEHQIDNEENI